MKRVIKMIWAILPLITFGQELVNIEPPNPESSSILKFMQVPVDLHNGIAQITIPLFDLKTKGVNIPISIQYHSRGVKVGEIASRVGLGWRLNAGGLISRQVRDGADDGRNGYLKNAILGNFYSKIFTDYTVRENLYNQLSTSDSNPDLVPDLFFYNYSGGGGKFIIDQIDREAVKQKFTNEKISYFMDNEGYIEGFSVIDSNGNEYYFGVYQEKESFSTSGSIDSKIVLNSTYIDTGGVSDNFKDTWYLLKIKTIKGEEIDFEYENEIVRYWERLFDGKKGSQGAPSVLESYEGEDSYSVVRKKEINERRLRKIIYNDVTIDFVPSQEQREDLMGSYSIDRIVVYNREEKVKEIRFEYRYKQNLDNANENWFLASLESSSTHAFGRTRLFLDKIRLIDVKSHLSENENIYSFKYNETPLPSRYSTSQDRWGYFNDEDNGNFLLYGDDPLDNRDVSVELSEAGMLKEIYLPTGGREIFEYEHNQGESAIPLNFSTNNVNTTTFNVTLSEFENMENGVYSKQFEILQPTTVRLSSWVSPMDGCGGEGDIPSNNYNSNCSFIMGLFEINTNIGGYLVPGNRLLYLSPGSYRLSVIPNVSNYNPYSMSESFYINLSYDQDSPSSNLIYGPGKRIKRMKIEEESNTKIINYNYSDGMIFGQPDYVYVYAPVPDGVNICFINRSDQLISSPQSNEIGYKNVEILEVGEHNEIKTTLEFTNIPDTGFFYHFPFHPSTDNEWLRGKLINEKKFKKTNSGQSKLISEKIYKYSYAGTDSPVIFTPIELELESLNFPNLVLPNDLMYLKTNNFFRFPLLIFSKLGSSQFVGLNEQSNNWEASEGSVGFRMYHFTGGTMDLSESVVKNYYPNGMEVRTVTKRDFDYTKNYNPIAIRTTTSLNDSVTQKFYYPQDLLGQGIQPNQMQRLIDENRIGQPIKTETFKNNEKISSSITKYNQFINDGMNLLLPSEVHNLKGEESGNVDLFYSSSRKISYDKYDTHGNILQYTPENGIPVSVVWGYESQYPIAKIEGRAYNSLNVSLINQIITAADNDQSESSEDTLRTKLRLLRNTYPDAMITTYTYDPLVGVTSITPPNGQTAYYEYDGFGRLESVKDEAGNKVQDIQYHYRPTP